MKSHSLQIGLVVCLLILAGSILAWLLRPSADAPVSEPRGVPAASAPAESVRVRSADERPNELGERSSAPGASGSAPEHRRAEQAGFVVRVVGPDGAPRGGVPVALASGPDVEAASEAALAAARDPARRAVGDSEGRARLEFPSTSASTDAVRVVRADVATERPVQVELDAAALEAGEATLELPPTGSVRVELDLLGTDAEAAGFPWQDVEVRLERLDPREREDPERAYERDGWSTPLGPDLAAAFAFVEVGPRYVAVVRRAGRFGSERSEAGGPAYDGHAARLSIPIVADEELVAVRLVDEAGRALPEGVRVELRTSTLAERTAPVPATTDADGRVLVATGELALGLVVEARTISEHPARSGSLVLARVGQLEGRASGGDLVLREPGLLAAGRVVDGAGEPLPEVLVRALTGSRRHDATTWDDVPVEARTDADGRFELRGPRPSEEVDLWAELAERATERRTVALGADDVLLELPAGAVVTGRLVPVELARAAVGEGRGRLVVVRAGERDAHRFELDEAGRFVLGPVAVGELEVVLTLGDEEVLTAGPFRLTEAGHDLGTLSLEGRVRRHELVLVGGPSEDEDEAEPEDPQAGFLALMRPRAGGRLTGSVQFRPAGAGDDVPWTTRILTGRRTALWSTAPAVDVEVEPVGYRDERVLALSGVHELQLRAGLRVRLVVETAGPLPAAPYRFGPTLRDDETGRVLAAPEGAEFLSDGAREVVLRVGRPGPARVGWTLVRQEGADFAQSRVLHDHTVVIEVADTDVEQVVRIPVDAGALEALVTDPPF